MILTKEFFSIKFVRYKYFFFWWIFNINFCFWYKFFLTIYFSVDIIKRYNFLSFIFFYKHKFSNNFFFDELEHVWNIQILYSWPFIFFLNDDFHYLIHGRTIHVPLFNQYIIIMIIVIILYQPFNIIYSFVLASASLLFPLYVKTPTQSLIKYRFIYFIIFCSS